MPVTVLVTPEERPAFAFALARVSDFYARGTSEQRESALSLFQMLQSLEATPPGAIEMELLTQDAFLLGIRLFYTSVELEERWLDACAGASGRPTVLSDDPGLESAVQAYFPQVLAEPLGTNFDAIRGVFTDLGVKLNRAITEAAPRARAIYNSDREEMSDKAVEIREQNARLRAAAAAQPASAVATAVAERPAVVDHSWGVDVPTGLAPDDIPSNSFRAMTIGSVRLFITNYGGQLAAFSGSCTHQQTGLAKGRLNGAIIECPRHGAQFDLTNGKQVCPPFCQVWMQRSGMVGRILALLTPDKRGGDLPHFPLRVESGEIVLRI